MSALPRTNSLSHFLQNSTRLAAALLAIALLPACAKKQWHYTPPRAPAPTKDFDAQFDSAHLDPNGAALNVDWHPQLAGRIPDPNACNQDQPYSLACTQNNPFQDQPSGINEAFCFLGKVFSGGQFQPFFGHADWMVAQHTGAIGWFNYGADFDYDLLLVPGTDNLPPLPPPNFNGHGITTNNNHVSTDTSPQYIELEFDSDETDPVFTQGWWNKFMTFGENNDTEELARLFHPSDPTNLACGSVVGLFGLDCDHGCRSELHPVYGLAVQRTEDRNDNQWSILARNWGTGGYCSQYNDELDETSFSILLPYTSPGKPSAELKDFVSAGTSSRSKVSCPKIYYWNGQAAVYLKLPRPDKQAVASFSLTLHWPDGAHSASCTQVKTEEMKMAREREVAALAALRPGAQAQEFEGRGEDYLAGLLHGTDLELARTQKATLRQKLASQNTPRAQRLAAMNAHRREGVCGTTVEVIESPPPQLKGKVTPLTDLKPDPVKTIRDAAIRDEICHKYDAQHPPPIGTAAQLQSACQGAAK